MIILTAKWQTDIMKTKNNLLNITKSYMIYIIVIFLVIALKGGAKLIETNLKILYLKTMIAALIFRGHAIQAIVFFAIKAIKSGLRLLWIFQKIKSVCLLPI